MKEKRLTAELWDKMHYLFRDFNDRMVHVELRYDYEIDIEALKTTLICFFEKAPVLHSCFVDNHISTHWNVKPYNIDDVLTVDYPENLEEAIDEFLTQYIPPESDLQMKVAVFFKDGKSVLCIIENHMCMDGGDLKYFIKALCKNYSDYVEKKISPIDLRTGSRSFEEVYSGFSKAEAGMARHLYKNINAKDDHAFPLTPDSIRDRSFIARRKIDSERFMKIKKAGKKYGATINDVLVAAYFFSLYDLADFDDSEKVAISCAIDLRRHMDSIDDKGITNHTAWMQCFIPERGKDIFQTIQYVVHSLNKFKKDKFMGLYGLPLLKFGYNILPHTASEEVIKLGYSNPLLAMSNIGILEADKLALAGNEPTDAFMSGAVKYKPYVLLSATTFRNELTLSMCVKGNDADKAIVEKFFDLMEENIGTVIADV